MACLGSAARRRPFVVRGLFLVLLSIVHGGVSGFASRKPASPVAGSATQAPKLLENKHVCVAGGGPCGLFLAALLVHHEPTVKITILEKTPRGGNNVNAFGIGLSQRLLHSLDAVPGLRQRVESVGALAAFGIKIASRYDISEQMTRFLEDKDRTEQCQIRFGEGCSDIDLAEKVVTTTAGRKLKYDLLIGCDGVNSVVRKTLVNKREVKEEHYLEPLQWKALRLPPQPDFDSSSVKRLQHPSFAGRILPRYPGGHIILAFWSEQDGINNPANADTPSELKDILTDALQDDAPKYFNRNIERLKLLGVKDEKDLIGKRREIIFEEEAVELFVKTRPSRSHYLKVHRFHDDSVALVGDSAHSMNTLLGQGCAAGLNSAEILVDCLLGSESRDLDTALKSYSRRAVRSAHAITDLGLLSYLIRAPPLIKLLMIPLTFIQKLRGRTVFERVNQIDIPYEKILKENRLLVALSRLLWKRTRLPFVPRAQ